MKKIVLVIFLTTALLACGKLTAPQQELLPQQVPGSNSYTSLSTIDDWYNNHVSDQLILQEGIVSKILQDDNEGSRHQKFILQLSDGRTLLVAHNIDIAKRIPDLQNNDTVIFKGEYEWNKKGGVIHWTHKDPDHLHDDGYLIHKKIKYE